MKAGSKQFRKILKQAKQDVLRDGNLEYSRDRFEVIPPHLYPLAFKQSSADLKRFCVWRSRDFLVQGFEEKEGVIRLAVTRAALASRGDLEPLRMASLGMSCNISSAGADTAIGWRLRSIRTIATL